MRTIRCLTSASLWIFMLVACARVAAAQTYVWTDEHGVVHAAADPSEVPPQYRAKSLRDASSDRPAVKVIPEESAPVPPVPAAPRAHTPIDVEDEPAPAPDPSNGGKAKGDQARKGKGLPPPDEGFEWHCANDPEGGPPKCEQFEKKNSKRARHAEARAKARKDLGVGVTDEFDPEVAKRVNERAEKEFKKSTPTPTTKAPKPSEDGDDEESDSSGDSED
jgi:hypothetical protein